MSAPAATRPTAAPAGADPYDLDQRHDPDQPDDLDRPDDLGRSADHRMVWETLAGRPIAIYLIDARALCGCLRWTDWYGPEHRGLERLAEDAVFLSRWLGQGEARLCVLVVTHTDEDCRRRPAGSGGGPMPDSVYKGHIRRQLGPLRRKLGGADRVRVVVGSLADRAGTEAVVAAVRGHIERWESGRRPGRFEGEANS